MTKFEVGDKVRIVYEGTVKRVGDFDFDIDTVHGIRYFTPSEPEVRDADLVERRKPKVGDVVSRRDARKLPVGSVIQGLTGALLIGHDGEIFDTTGSHLEREYDRAGTQYPIIYLPD